MPSGLTIGTERAKALQQAIQDELMKWGYSAEPDNVMAEFITIMLINNKTPEQITSELEELIGADFDQRFTDWLFAEAAKGSSDSAISSESPSRQPENSAPSQNESSRRNSNAPRNGIYHQALSQALPSAGHKRTNSARSPSPSHPNKVRRTDLPTAPRAMQRDGPSNSRSLIERVGGPLVRNSHQDEIQARIDNVTQAAPDQQMMMPGAYPGMDMNAMAAAAAMSGGIGIQELMVGQMALMAQFLGHFGQGGFNPMQMGGDMSMMMNGMQSGSFQDASMNGRGRGRGGRGARGSGRGRGGVPRSAEDEVSNTTSPSDPLPVVAPNPAPVVSSPDPAAAQRPGFVIPERPQSPTLCKFGPKCSNAHCRYSHPSPVATPESGVVLSNEACENGKDCKDKDCVKAHVSPAVLNPQAAHSIPNAHIPQPPPSFQPHANPVPCRFGNACTRPNCTFQHPSRAPATNFTQPCRFGASCTRATCAFQHPEGRVLPGSFHRGLSTSAPLVNVPTPETGSIGGPSPHKTVNFAKTANMKEKLEQQMKEIEEKKLEAENAVKAAQAAAANKKDDSKSVAVSA